MAKTQLINFIYFDVVRGMGSKRARENLIKQVTIGDGSDVTFIRAKHLLLYGKESEKALLEFSWF